VREEDSLIVFQDADLALHEGDAYDVLVEMEEGSVDAIVTSPPYLDARPEYLSPSLDEFTAIFRELRRVCQGAFLMNVGRLWRDRRELLWWHDLLVQAEHVGWPLRDTLLWIKPNANPIQGEILSNAHEYVFMLGDGFDPDSVRREYAPGSKERLARRWVSSISVKGDDAERSGSRRQERRGERRTHNPDGARANSYIEIYTGGEKGNPHPAPMPLALAKHLVRLSGGKTILDPFAGSGTTLLAARMLGRHAIGIESSNQYCVHAAERLAQQSLFAGEEVR
jgi:DNA modification methylase